MGVYYVNWVSENVIDILEFIYFFKVIENKILYFVGGVNSGCGDRRLEVLR